jgi:hypothetical protein
MEMRSSVRSNAMRLHAARLSIFFSLVRVVGSRIAHSTFAKMDVSMAPASSEVRVVALVCQC